MTRETRPPNPPVAQVVMSQDAAEITVLAETHRVTATTGEAVEDQVLDILLAAAELGGGRVHVQVSGAEEREFILSAEGEVQDVAAVVAGPPPVTVGAAAVAPARQQPGSGLVVAGGPPPGRGRGINPRVPVGVAAAVAVLVAGAGVVLIAGDDSQNPEGGGRNAAVATQVPTAGTPSSTPSSVPAPVAPVPVQRVEPVRAEVQVTGGVGTLRLAVLASRPWRMRVMVRGPEGRLIRNTIVQARATRTTLVGLEDLRPGPHHWSVSPVGAPGPTRSGATRVLAPRTPPPASPYVPPSSPPSSLPPASPYVPPSSPPSSSSPPDGSSGSGSGGSGSGGSGSGGNAPAPPDGGPPPSGPVHG